MSRGFGMTGYREPVQVNNTQSGGIGFVGLLTIVFIVLKLTGVIAWSWVWVLSPIWIAIGVMLLILGIAFGLFVVFGGH
jgi:hypothetical protein